MFRIAIKGPGNEADFLGFLQKLVPYRYLTLPFERSAFGFEFAEILAIEKRLPDSASRRLSDSASRLLSDSAFECLRENSASRRAGESLTPRLSESKSCQLAESGSRHGESGSRYSNFLKFSIDFPNFKWLNQPSL
jgi:hypothetical protein